jgi:hypothetical protein
MGAAHVRAALQRVGCSTTVLVYLGERLCPTRVYRP